MRKVAVTCVFELTYNDSVTDEDINLDVEYMYVNQHRLVADYNDTFTIVEIENLYD